METIQSLRARLEDIDAQIAPLEAERKIIQKRLRSLTYPVLSLPFDVTSEIFVHCLPDMQNSEPMFNFHQLPTPLLLSQICRAWRHVAFKTPTIWTIFRISVNDWPKLGSRRLAEWVDRAGSSPLSFILFRRESFAPIPTSPAILLPILALSRQWRDVDLRLPYMDFVTEEFQSGLRGRLPVLETLRITALADISTKTTTVTTFEQAPNLRTVFLERLAPALILLPWKQLTHFRGERFYGMDCLHVLRLAVSLVECKFAGVDQDIEQTALLSPHLGLKVLDLTGEAVCLDLLCVLTLPSLRQLRFTDIGTSQYHEEFVSFLSRSHPPLQHLSLHSGYLRLVHGFPFFLQLTVLELTGLTVVEMSGFFRILQSNSFLPRLKTIVSSVLESIRFYFPPEKAPAINYGDMADALACRWNRNDRLETFRMTWSRNGCGGDDENRLLLNPPPDFCLTLPRLLDLVEEGMQISVMAEVRQMTQVWI
ncbi:hypothetical protein B0H19DRAFT_1169848 [Mycena capillaripes]|nr:hypothetical protein B0H19DRAFT_1169848 [Mycena capillaripes]